MWANRPQANPAPPRPQDAPQKQTQQKDLRPARDPSYRRPLFTLPQAHTYRPGQQGARARVQHARSSQVPTRRRQIRRVDQTQAARHGLGGSPGSPVAKTTTSPFFLPLGEVEGSGTRPNTEPRPAGGYVIRSPARSATQYVPRCASSARGDLRFRCSRPALRGLLPP